MQSPRVLVSSAETRRLQRGFQLAAPRKNLKALYRVSDLSAETNGVQLAPPHHGQLVDEANVHLLIGPGSSCTPRHRMPFHSMNEGSKCVSMTWRGLPVDIARHITECRLIQETRVQMRVDDVAMGLTYIACQLSRHRMPSHSGNEGSECVG